MPNFYGVYVGKVEDNEDPLKIGRLKVRVPSIFGEESEIPTDKLPWADPNFPYGGSDDVGFFFVPEKEATVNVLFIGGDSNKPVWIGCNYSQFETYGTPKPPGEAMSKYPKRKVLKTKAGYICFDDEEKSITIKSGGNSSYFGMSEREIEIVHASGAHATIKQDGSIAMESPEQIRQRDPNTKAQWNLIKQICQKLDIPTSSAEPFKAKTWGGPKSTPSCKTEMPKPIKFTGGWGGSPGQVLPNTGGGWPAGGVSSGWGYPNAPEIPKGIADKSQELVKNMIDAGACAPEMDGILQKALNGEKEVPLELGGMFNGMLDMGNKSSGGLSIPGFEGDFVSSSVDMASNASQQIAQGGFPLQFFASTLSISPKYGTLIVQAMNETIKYKNEGLFEKDEILNSDLIPDLTPELCKKYTAQLKTVEIDDDTKDIMRSLVKRVDRYENGDSELGIDNNDQNTGDMLYKGDKYKIYRQEGLTQLIEDSDSDNDDSDDDDTTPTPESGSSASLKDMIVMALIFGRN